MPPNINDAKTGTESSTSQDANGASSTSNDGQAKDQVKSIADAAREAVDASNATTEGSQPKGQDTGAVPQQDTTETETAATETEAATTDDTTLPFHDHPRWKELLKERDDAKKARDEIDAKFKETNPLLEQWAFHTNFIQEHNINPEDVATVMNFLATRQLDPVRARDLIKPLWESLSPYDPEVIPADLQARVKEGDMTLELAKEMAALRAKANGSDRFTKATVEQQARANQQNMVRALASWTQTINKTDPDFKPKKPGEKDGLYELTAKGYAYLQSMTPPRSPQEAVALVEQALSEARAFFSGQARPAKVAPRLTSSQSSATPKAPPKSIREVVAQAAKAHGITVPA